MLILVGLNGKLASIMLACGKCACASCLCQPLELVLVFIEVDNSRIIISSLGSFLTILFKMYLLAMTFLAV